MAYFYSELISTGTNKTKGGTKDSGMVAKAYSKDVGGSIAMDTRDGNDIVRMRLIEGSGYGGPEVSNCQVIAQVKDNELVVNTVNIDGWVCVPYGKATDKQRDAIMASIKLIMAAS
jgi:hypothetical protein